MKGNPFPNIIFLHGLFSNSQAYKASIIRKSYPELIVPDFAGSFQERMGTLYPILGKLKDWIIIGSSFGGLMGALYTCKNPEQVKKLVMLAPALMLPEFASYMDSSTSLSTGRKPVPVPTIIIHGTKDTIVPLEDVRQIATKVFSNLTYHIVDDDHHLHVAADTLNWKELLS